MRFARTREIGAGILIGAGLAIVAVFVFETGTPNGTITRTIIEASVETISQNVTISSTQQAPAEEVGEAFASHLLAFGSRNVTAIISQYEPSANVTWEHFACLSGIYPISGSNGPFKEGLDTFFNKNQGLDAVIVGNVTSMRISSLSNDSIVVNSTFGLVGHGVPSNLTATISAQDIYTYSATSRTWLISEEVWNFMSLDFSGFLFCDPALMPMTTDAP